MPDGLDLPIDSILILLGLSLALCGLLTCCNGLIASVSLHKGLSVFRVAGGLLVVVLVVLVVLFIVVAVVVVLSLSAEG